MIRWSLLLALAAGLVAYAFWVYLRIELRVPRSRRLAMVRAVTLVLLLALLFDVRLPGGGVGASRERWVLLDASLSMSAVAPGGPSGWEEASARAAELVDEGWRIVTFGAGTAGVGAEVEPAAIATESLLSPALQRAAEAGVRTVRVLSDFRLQDQVAATAALAELAVEVSFERFGGNVSNAGVSALDVPDLVRPGGSVTAEVEVHATGGDSLTVRVFEEDREVAEVSVAAPSPGLRLRVPVELPTPLGQGRVRYSASVSLDGDGFSSDDVAVRYAGVGSEEGALLLVSLTPDWEPRYLLPVLEEVTGLPAIGYLRVGPDAFVGMGRAIERGGPVDSAYVRTAAADAAVLVLHGLDAASDDWARSLVERPGRKIFLPGDAAGAELAGVPSGEARDGEWYASAEIPTSPVAGSLSGLPLQGLPPLSDVLLPDDPSQVRGALLVQLRGAGTPEAALHLDERESGRVAIVLASGFWRWATRADGREAYRRLWSGVAGWLLADQDVSAGEARPAQWVVTRGDPVAWSLPPDNLDRRLVVSSADSILLGAADSIVVDTVVGGGGAVSTGVLPPGNYRYRFAGADGATLDSGRFDVAASTAEMVPAVAELLPGEGVEGETTLRAEPPGQPLRTRPWPYLLMIALLCGEWIGRRRSGLR